MLNVVLYIDPITNQPAQMPLQMVKAYVPFLSDLCLEDAARVAAIRDNEAAINLLDSIVDDPLLSSGDDPEGTGFDRLSVEAPSLR